MRVQLSSYVFLALSVVSATADIFASHPYIKPGPNDLRGPCPGLNTLANHGFLPRDGRNLTIRNVLKAGIDAFNVQNDVLLLPAKIGLTAGPALDTFTLADIRLHNSIEHDASVSRSDFFSGDNFSFNETIFQTLLNSSPGNNFYDGVSAGQVQKERLTLARQINPQLINTAKEFAIRTRESSLYLSVMGDVTTGKAPKNFVQIFFQEERLPIKEGWKRSPVPITGDAVSPIEDTISTNSDWTPDPVCASVTFILSGNDTFTV